MPTRRTDEPIEGARCGSRRARQNDAGAFDVEKSTVIQVSRRAPTANAEIVAVSDRAVPSVLSNVRDAV